VPQISAKEFQRLPLRVHAFMTGVPLHDAWAVDLPRSRDGISLADFLRATNGQMFGALPPIVRTLLRLRFFVGRLFHWDDATTSTGRRQTLVDQRNTLPGQSKTPADPSHTLTDPSLTFADRLTPADRERSLAQPGTRDGAFRVVYRFEDEQLVELVNRTAHAAAVSALVETATSYRFYFAVYVRGAGKLTPLYMALIDPFRKLLVYPSLLRGVRATWDRTVGSR
jgi:hypothetical protein